MGDFVAALGLALAVEGLLFSLFPEAMKRAMADAVASPTDRLRLVGLASAVGGVALVWAARRLAF